MTKPKWAERPWPPTANNWQDWQWHRPQAGDVFTLELANITISRNAGNEWPEPSEALIFLRYEEGRLYYKRPFDSKELWVLGICAKVTLQQKRIED